MSGAVRRALRRLSGGGPSRTGLVVRDAMSTEVVTVTPGDTVRETARRMAERDVAAALVEADAVGIVTARDLLDLVAAGRDGDAERVADHHTAEVRSTAPDTALVEAADTMVEAGIRHLVVVEGGRSAGVLAMRDVVRCWVDEGAAPRDPVPIWKAMSTDLLEVEGGETVRQAARAMSERRAAAAVVTPGGDRPYPGIFTERELVGVLGAGEDPDSARISDHLAARMTFSAPGWSVKQAAEAIRKGGFQHVVVVDQHQVRGVIGVRDIVRAWMRIAD